MEEFKDGSFGEIKPADELLKYFQEGVNPEVKALHFGNEQELLQVKQEATIKERLDQVEEYIQGKLHDRGFLIIPTDRQIDEVQRACLEVLKGSNVCID